jgi:hypothetical protein
MERAVWARLLLTELLTSTASSASIDDVDGTTCKLEEIAMRGIDDHQRSGKRRPDGVAAALLELRNRQNRSEVRPRQLARGWNAWRWRSVVWWIFGVTALALASSRLLHAPKAPSTGSTMHPGQTERSRSARQEPSTIGTGAPQGPGLERLRADAARGISGVVRERGGSALAAARVCLIVEHECCMAPRCVLSDAAGSFDIEGAHATSVAVSASGYLPRSVALAASGPARLSIELVRGGERISGHVADATGGSVGGAWVSVRTGAERGYAVSDDDGGFELNVAPGKGKLLVHAEGYSRLERDVWVPSSDLALVLVPASSIRGRVVAAATGAPLEGVLVYASSSNALRVGTEPVATLSDGVFSVDDLAAGTYALWAQSAQWRSPERAVSLAVGQTLDDLVLAAEPATHLIGGVSVESAPCSHGSIALTGPLAVAANVESGALRIDGLLPGTYDIEVRCDGATSLEEQLLVADAPIRRDWDLDAGLSLHGSVETDGGEPVAGATVQVTPREPLADAPDARCVSDATGRFECRGLLPGDYDCALDPAWGGDSQGVRLGHAMAPSLVRLRSLATGSIRVQLIGPEQADIAALALRARRGDGRWIEGSAAEGGFRFADLPLGDYELAFDPPGVDAFHAALSRAGESITLAMPLPPRGSLSGRVVDERGEPVVEAWVIARPSGLDLPPLRKSAVPALTDAAGAFAFDHLLRGRYDLEIVAASGSSSVSGIETGSPSLSIELPTHASVTVRATLNGTPVEQFSLAYAESPGTTGHVGHVANGLWSAPSLPPGTYRFAASTRGAVAVRSIELAPGSQLQLVLSLSSAPARETSDAVELLESDPERAAGGG